MKKKVIPCQVRNEQLLGAGVVAGAAGSGNDVILQLHFGESWAGLVKYVTFRNALGEEPVVVLLTTDMLEERRRSAAREPGPERGQAQGRTAAQDQPKSEGRQPSGQPDAQLDSPGAPSRRAPQPESEEGQGQQTEGEDPVCPAVCPCSEVYNVPIPAAAKALQGQMPVTVQGYELSADGSQVETAAMTATAYFRVLPADYAMPEDGSIAPTLSQQLQGEIEYMAKHYLKLDGDQAASSFAVHSSQDSKKQLFFSTIPMIDLADSSEDPKATRLEAGAVSVMDKWGKAKLSSRELSLGHSRMEDQILGSGDGAQSALVLEGERGEGILLRGLATPVEDTDGVNKKYVDDAKTESIAEAAKAGAEAALAAGDGRYLPLAGGKLSGDLILEGGLDDTPGFGIINRDIDYITSIGTGILSFGRMSDDGIGDMISIESNRGILLLQHNHNFEHPEQPVLVKGVKTPEEGTDAANKGYVDAHVIDSAHLADGAVTGTKLGAAVVTSAKLANGAVTEAKLAQAVQDKLNAAGDLTEAAADGKYLKLAEGGVLVGPEVHNGAASKISLIPSEKKLKITSAWAITDSGYQGTSELSSGALTFLEGDGSDNKKNMIMMSVSPTTGAVTFIMKDKDGKTGYPKLAGAAAPTTDVGVANKKYVDDHVTDSAHLADGAVTEAKLDQVVKDKLNAAGSGGGLSQETADGRYLRLELDTAGEVIKFPQSRVNGIAYPPSDREVQIGLMKDDSQNPDPLISVRHGGQICGLYPYGVTTLKEDGSFGISLVFETDGEIKLYAADGGDVELSGVAVPVLDNSAVPKSYVDQKLLEIKRTLNEYFADTIFDLEG